METAFTLLEVIVVTVVVGILAAMVIPKFANAQGETTTAMAAEDLRTMAQAIELYQGVNGSFPPNASRADDAILMGSYFKGYNPFEMSSPIGGVYDYENQSKVAVLIVPVGNDTYSNADAVALDEYMDDGNLNLGKLREINSQLRYRFDGN